MIEKLQLTLYEMFGYLLPGAIASAAVSILYWSLSLPNVDPNVFGWSVIIALSYFFGHISQGIGNRFFRGVEEKTLGPKGSLSKVIVDIARRKAGHRVGTEPDDIDSSSLFRIADEASVQVGADADRDIFIYREGFYKGSAVAFSFLTIALIVRGLDGYAAIRLPDYSFYFSAWQIFAAAVVSAAAANICRQRFYRFGAYRVSRAIYAFVVTSKN
jgi:hypothetical protein